jgi:hypothetical protein
LKAQDDGHQPVSAPEKASNESRWRLLARSIFWTVMVIVAGVVTVGTIVAGVYPRVSTFLECGSISACYR